MFNAGIEAIVQTVAFEVDIFGYPFIERVVGQVVAVEFLWEIRIPDVVDLRVAREGGLGRVAICTRFGRVFLK